MFSNVSRLSLIGLLLCLLLALPAATYAQDRGGDRPSPGSSGGNVGGPGMSGGAMTAGRSTPDVSAPDLNGGGTGGFGGGQGGVGGNAGGGRGFGGAAGDFDGDGQTDGGRPFGRGPDTTPTADYDGDGIPDIGVFGGFGGGFGGVLNLEGRFGQRGTSSLPVEGIAGTDEGRGWLAELNRGGFGALSFGGDSENLSDLSTIEGNPWRPSDAETALPAAPAALDDFESLETWQTQAQTALDQVAAEAAASADQVSENVQATADEAVEAAEDAYDQFWEDYYEAVDYTAQVYYDTVTAEYDYLLQTYQQAVDYTAATVDYYVAYAAQYASYCALYPWDCYSYAYDAATNTYVYVGDVSDTPVATVEIGDVTVNATLPVAPAPEPSAEAYEAIVVFANDQLGAVVEPLYAGSATEQVQAVINRMPAEMQAFLTNATSISGATYWGLLNGGVAAVLAGDCTTGNCAVSAENLDLHLSSGAAGAYGISASAPMPATADEALALITQVYPKLEGLAFAQITDVEQGMAFTATTASMGFDPNTLQPVSVAKVVYAGVVEFNGSPFVYALVAVGEGYVDIFG